MKNLFAYDKALIAVIKYIKEHYEIHENSDLKARKSTIQGGLKSEGYSDSDVNEAIDNLMEVGYLYTKNNNFFLTEKGEIFLEDYNLRKIEPFFVTVGKFIRRNLSEVFSVMAVVISIIGLLVK